MRFSEPKWFLYSKSSGNVFLKEDDKFRDLKVSERERFWILGMYTFILYVSR